jgi:selenocysteine-specific elongation factor
MYNPLKEKEIEKLLGMSKQLIDSIVSDNQNLELIKVNNNSFLVSISQKKIIENRVEEIIKAYHLKNKFEIGIPKEELIENISSDRDFINFIIDKIYHEKRIKIFKDKISMFNYSFELTKEEKIICDDIISLIHNEHFVTSSIDEIASQLNKNSSKIKEMIKLASSANKLLVISGQFIFSMENINNLLDVIKAHFLKNESMTVSDFKLLAKTSRKYAVPLLEYFDKEKITLRIGNERKLLIEK